MAVTWRQICRVPPPFPFVLIVKRCSMSRLCLGFIFGLYLSDIDNSIAWASPNFFELYESVPLIGERVENHVARSGHALFSPFSLVFFFSFSVPPPTNQMKQWWKHVLRMCNVSVRTPRTSSCELPDLFSFSLALQFDYIARHSLAIFATCAN